MGGIFSKLCCLPKNPKGPLKKRISSLIIERSSSTQVQSIKIEEEESPELKRYKRILEKDFEVEIDLLCDNNFEGIEFKVQLICNTDFLHTCVMVQCSHSS